MARVGITPRAPPASTSPRAFRPHWPNVPWRWRSTAPSSISPIRSKKDAKLEFLTRDDPRALELIRHDAAHIMAEAVQLLWPGTQVTIGPVIENGFYYDFFRNQPFTLEDLPVIEKKDEGDHRARQTFHQGSVVARRGQEGVPRQGRELQGRIDRRHSGRPIAENLQAGRMVRPVPRPAYDFGRQGRQRLQADEGGGRLLARRPRTTRC